MPLASLRASASRAPPAGRFTAPHSLQPGRFQSADKGQVKVIYSWKTWIVARGLDPEPPRPSSHAALMFAPLLFLGQSRFSGRSRGPERGMRWSAWQEKSPFHGARATVPQCLSPPGAAHKRALVRTACSLAASLTPGSPRCTFSPMLPCYVISLWLSEISFFYIFFFSCFLAASCYL